MLTPTPMNTLAERQGLRILSVMSPYSINRLLEHIEQGEVIGDGYVELKGEGLYDRYDVNSETYVIGEEDRPAAESEVVCCLLGWGGFLEQTSYLVLRRRVNARYGDYGRWNITTEEIENYLGGIREGDTPEDCPLSAGFKQLVLDFKEGRKKAQPVDRAELALYIELNGLEWEVDDLEATLVS